MGLLRINELAPVASTISYAGETPPEGWLICDGSAISRSGYADLFGVIGETFGSGDGSTTFNLPDLETRVAVGKGTGKVLGSKGGAMNMTPTGSVQNKTLSLSQVPSHTHTTAPHNHVSAYIKSSCIIIGGTTSPRQVIIPGCGGGLGTTCYELQQTPYASDTSSITVCSTGSGGDLSHDHSFTSDPVSVEQPYTVLNYIIKY